jgi:hypothetical protein
LAFLAVLAFFALAFPFLAAAVPLTVIVAFMFAPLAPILVIVTNVSWPEYDFELGLDVPVNVTFFELPG